MSALAALPPFPRTRTRGSSTAAWLVVLVATVAVCSRLAISHYGVTMIEAIVAAPLFLMIAQRPLLAVTILLVLLSSVFSYGYLPRFNVPGHPPVNLGDVCLAAALGGTLWRAPWLRWPSVVRRYSLLLTLFLLLAAVATVKTSLGGYVDSRNALYEYRNWLYLGVAVTIALELRGKYWPVLLNTAVAIAAAVAVISLSAAASHAVASVVTHVSPTQGSVLQEVNGAGADAGAAAATRVRVVGLYFVYAMCVPTLVMVLVLKDRWRAVRIGALVLMLAAIAVSLNRNMYLGLLIALLITTLLGGARLRGRVVAACAVGTALLVLLAVGPAVPGVATEAGRRAATALSPSALVTSGSIQDRAYELRFALTAIGHHPWFGVGPNQFYGAWLANADGQLTPRFFVQNLYVYIATDYGVLAALAFLTLPGVCLLLGLARLSRAQTALDRALLAGFIGTLVALMLSLLVGTYLQDPGTTTAFAVLSGLLVAASLRTFRLTPSHRSARTSWNVLIQRETSRE
jgi:hypothetical protein